MRPTILVLAGVNGAGKSSIGGAHLAAHGLPFFNPDTFARALLERTGMAGEDANAAAWRVGLNHLLAAIEHQHSYAFETTLGGDTITRTLLSAADTHHLSIWYCGLASVEQHIQRVEARAAAGGHSIPEHKIRERWTAAPLNLVTLMRTVVDIDVRVFDNSLTAAHGEPIPAPRLVLDYSSSINGKRTLAAPANLQEAHATPEWAKPIVGAAMKLCEGREG